MPKKFFAALVFSISCLAFSGCATYLDETQNLRQSWAAGGAAAAQGEIEGILKEKEGSGDELVWLLEMGAAARASANFAASGAAFKKAEEKIEIFENDTDAKILEETRALLVNQSYIPYKGYNYDKIMMSAYQAMNLVEQKKYEDAAVYLMRLDMYQKNAKDLNEKRILREAKALEKAQSQESKTNSAASYDASLTLSAPESRGKLSQIYGADWDARNAAEIQASAIYENPFAHWLTGVFFANYHKDQSDKDRSLQAFERANIMLGGKSKILLEDIAAAKSPSKRQNITYVVFETGCAPVRDQIRIDLPIYIFARNVPHVSMNFPYLKCQDSFAQNISVSAGGQTHQLETIADMDAIIKREFDQLLPMIIAKTVISSAMKAAAQYAANQAAAKAGGEWAQLGVNIAGSIYQTLTNDADLRTWSTLPKQIKIARFPTPQDGIVKIENGAIQVDAGSANIIFVKKMSAGGNMIVRVCGFDKNKK
ncbi:MAG: hypothetical protein J6T16_05395 [Opitutales bacterium]|nr:hypothetical protein [Opitutales bacterium]